MSPRRIFLVILLTLALGLASVGRAAAEPGPITLVSRTALEQAENATAPALSADGHYLAFEGVIGGLRGVFREDLQTDEIVAVSAGSFPTFPARSPAATAKAPSISADGRYVSFTTQAALDPTDDSGEESWDVYVADMSTVPPTYELASALNASSEGLAYTATGGSQAAGRVALSGDGRKVAFVTEAPSDLDGEGLPAPAGQVVIRDLATRETSLVSVVRNSATSQMEPGVPVPGGAVNTRQKDWNGAAISADGTTVAWLGTDLPAQVPLLAEEAAEIEAHPGESEQPYDEPLWRRVANGPDAPTRRITGGVGDSQAPGCPIGGSVAIAACVGVFPEVFKKEAEAKETGRGWLGVVTADGVPALSADGSAVALLGDPTNSGSVNLFVVDMAEGLGRSQAVRRLTREVLLQPQRPANDINTTGFLAQAGHIFDFGLSVDGSRIAFVTARQQFPLAPPTLIGSPPSGEGLVELYALDLDSETLQRLTHGDGGADEPSLPKTEGGSLSAEKGAGATDPSLDADGEVIAFGSTAVNLVSGDGNEASDVFTVDDPRSPTAPASNAIAPRTQASQVPPPGWRLRLSASSLPNGKVRLVGVVPAGGTLRAQVRASLAVGHKARRLTSAHKRARAAGRLALVLALAHGARHLAHVVGGLTATARVTFNSPQGKPLEGRLQVRFRVHKAKHKGRRHR